MKICLISNLYPPYTQGGAGLVVYDTARQLVAEGHDVVVITSLAEPPGKQVAQITKDIEDGIVVYRYWVPNICSYRALRKKNILVKVLWHLINLRNTKSMRLVADILEEENPDVVHTHNIMGLGFGLPRLIQSLGYKHIHTVHDVQLVEPSGIMPHNAESLTLVQRLYSAYMRYAFGSPLLVVAPSQFLADFYKKYKFFPGSAWYTPPEPQKNPMDRHEKYKQHALEIACVFVGALVPHKGIEVLLEAWKTLPNVVRTQLHIIGNGPLKPMVEEYAHLDRRVTVHGYRTPQQLRELYKQVDVLIFPSVCIENRPNVIIEALAHGLVVIAAGTGGAPELIEHGVNGLIAAPGNAVELSQRIRQIVFQDKQVPRDREHMQVPQFLHAYTDVYRNLPSV